MIIPHELRNREFPPGVTREWIGVGSSWFGPTSLPLIVLRGAPGPRVVAVAAQHGDEAFAILGLHRLAEELDTELLSGELWLLPCLNVHAYAHGSRVSPFDQHDMNRVHPGDARGTVTEQISKVLCQHVLPDTELLIDLHGGSPENGDIAFARWTDVADKPSVRSVAESLPVEFLVDSDSKNLPGMLSSASETFGVPQISIEACNAYAPARENAAEMANFVLVCLKALGMLPGEVPKGRRPPLRKTITHRAHTGGAFETHVDFGQVVAEGQFLGVVRNLAGERVQEVMALAVGTVSVMRNGVRVHPGETLCTLSVDVEV